MLNWDLVWSLLPMWQEQTPVRKHPFFPAKQGSCVTNKSTLLFFFFFLFDSSNSWGGRITSPSWEKMKVITAITITVLSSRQHYHLKLFPLPCSHSGVLPITETCPAHLVWPARHVLKEVLCRREIWSEFGKEGNTKTTEQEQDERAGIDALTRRYPFTQAMAWTVICRAGALTFLPQAWTKLSYSLQQIINPVIKTVLFSLCRTLI